MAGSHQMSYFGRLKSGGGKSGKGGQHADSHGFQPPPQSTVDMGELKQVMIRRKNRPTPTRQLFGVNCPQKDAVGSSSDDAAPPAEPAANGDHDGVVENGTDAAPPPPSSSAPISQAVSAKEIKSSLRKSKRKSRGKMSHRRRESASAVDIASACKASASPVPASCRSASSSPQVTPSSSSQTRFTGKSTGSASGSKSMRSPGKLMRRATVQNLTRVGPKRSNQNQNHAEVFPASEDRSPLRRRLFTNLSRESNTDSSNDKTNDANGNGSDTTTIRSDSPLASGSGSDDEHTVTNDSANNSTTPSSESGTASYRHSLCGPATDRRRSSFPGLPPPELLAPQPPVEGRTLSDSAPDMGASVAPFDSSTPLPTVSLPETASTASPSSDTHSPPTIGTTTPASDNTSPPHTPAPHPPVDVAPHLNASTLSESPSQEETPAAEASRSPSVLRSSRGKRRPKTPEQSRRKSGKHKIMSLDESCDELDDTGGDASTGSSDSHRSSLRLSISAAFARSKGKKKGGSVVSSHSSPSSPRVSLMTTTPIADSPSFGDIVEELSPRGICDDNTDSAAEVPTLGKSASMINYNTSANGGDFVMTSPRSTQSRPATRSRSLSTESFDSKAMDYVYRRNKATHISLSPLASLRYNEEGEVTSGNFDDLTQWVMEKGTDSDIATYLLCYRSFKTPIDVFLTIKDTVSDSLTSEDCAKSAYRLCRVWASNLYRSDFEGKEVITVIDESSGEPVEVGARLPKIVLRYFSNAARLNRITIKELNSLKLLFIKKLDDQFCGVSAIKPPSSPMVTSRGDPTTSSSSLPNLLDGKSSPLTSRAAMTPSPVPSASQLAAFVPSPSSTDSLLSVSTQSAGGGTPDEHGPVPLIQLNQSLSSVQFSSSDSEEAGYPSLPSPTSQQRSDGSADNISPQSSCDHIFADVVEMTSSQKRKIKNKKRNSLKIALHSLTALSLSQAAGALSPTFKPSNYPSGVVDGSRVTSPSVSPGASPRTVVATAEKIPAGIGNGYSDLFVDQSVEAITMQITRAEAQLFAEVSPLDLYSTSNSFPTAGVGNPLQCLSDRFNRVSQWVSTRIITPKEVDRQTANVVKFIAVAKRLVIQRNYNSAMQILSGINNSAILRLKCVQRLPVKVRESFEKMEDLMSPRQNFKAYRALSQEPPFLPFLAVFLRDLRFAADGNSDYAVAAEGTCGDEEADELIHGKNGSNPKLNYDKWRLHSNMIFKFVRDTRSSLSIFNTRWRAAGPILSTGSIGIPIDAAGGGQGASDGGDGLMPPELLAEWNDLPGIIEQEALYRLSVHREPPTNEPNAIELAYGIGDTVRRLPPISLINIRSYTVVEQTVQPGLGVVTIYWNPLMTSFISRLMRCRRERGQLCNPLLQLVEATKMAKPTSDRGGGVARAVAAASSSEEEAITDCSTSSITSSQDTEETEVMVEQGESVVNEEAVERSTPVKTEAQPPASVATPDKATKQGGNATLKKNGSRIGNKKLRKSGSAFRRRVRRDKRSEGDISE
eukprot:TRINITY_DN7118_c0_g1_i1.p1 TRINITY_DN7118_c0_g1~~TRINITY_DN7118_c0_g1_i1.p1  ORF type:complete len:1511 (+),score=351.70 TRINITY_DN7118_c0_g1_i1:229-4761(+)